MVARAHAELGNPSDVRLWSGDQTLRWLVRHGWDGVGALVVGEEAYGRYVKAALTPPDAVPRAKRARRYADLALDAVRHGLPGSSAAGEQPKFLALREDDDGVVPVLVKFSPPVDNPVAERVADLLIAEHLALRAIATAGRQAATTDELGVHGFEGDLPEPMVRPVAIEPLYL